MFEFVSTKVPPVEVKIDGVTYRVPRFLNDQFAEWASRRREKIVQEAMSQLQSEDRRAQFLIYHQPPPLDILWIGQHMTTPDGARELVREQLAKAGVPAEKVDGLVENADPMLVRNFADELRSGNGMIKSKAADSGDGGESSNPLSGQPRTSDGSPTVKPPTSPTSLEHTPEPTSGN